MLACMPQPSWTFTPRIVPLKLIPSCLANFSRCNTSKVSRVLVVAPEPNPEVRAVVLSLQSVGNR